MPRSTKRYSVYPAERTTALLGRTSPSLNQSLDCWAELVRQCTVDQERQGRSVQRVKISVAEMRRLLDGKGLENTPDNRATIIALKGGS